MNEPRPTLEGCATEVQQSQPVQTRPITDLSLAKQGRHRETVALWAGKVSKERRLVFSLFIDLACVSGRGVTQSTPCAKDVPVITNVF